MQNEGGKLDVIFRNSSFIIQARLVLIVSVFLLTVLGTGLGSRRSQATAACGNPTNGVQLCLTSSAANLELAFRNIDDREVLLNLGVMIANGKAHLPNRIVLKFTDPQGKTRLCKLRDQRYAGVFGRLDDYVLPLRAGSTYTLQLTLNQFWCQETNEFSIPLLAGDNHLTAHFEGTGAQFVSSDMAGLKLMNFWLGNVESNMLTIRR